MSERITIEQHSIVYNGDEDRRILLDCSKLMDNISSLPMKSIAEDGSTDYPQIRIIRTLADGSDNAESDIVLFSLLCDTLNRYSRPLRIALFSFEGEGLKSLAFIISKYSEEHEIILVDPEKYEQLRESGFDLVVANAKKGLERALLGAIKYLVHPDSRCIVYAEDSGIFGDLSDLFLTGYDSFECDDSASVFSFTGADLDDDIFFERKASQLYEVIAEDAHNAIRENADDNDLYKITLRINVATNLAQDQWDHDTKQKLLDLKEEIQEHMI